MKKKIAIIALTLFTSNPVFSTGIPTVDLAGISQMVATNSMRMNEFVQELQEARNRLQQMKDTAEHYKKMVEGVSDFKDVINITNNAQFALSNWKSIYNDTSDLNVLRKQFDMESSDPDIQKEYDKSLLGYRNQQRFYQTNVARNNRMKNLLSSFTDADTPSKKAEIANTLNYEQLQMENDNKIMETLNDLVLKEQRLELSTKARQNVSKILTYTPFK